MGSDDGFIEIIDVTKAFGPADRRVYALGGVAATIRRGEFFTLLGPSGCGKTTLLRLIAGFELPTSGEIRLDGQEIGHLPPFRRPVNTVFQNYALFPHMTVAQNIGFGLEMLGKPKADIAATVERMLALVKMTDLAGFGQFLQNLKNQGMHPHLMGDFPVVRDPVGTQQKPRKPYLVQ